MTIQIVRSQIRFQLEQLKTKNQHHGFEDIAREFARQRICRNLLPGTGPVGTGGDQGRDFETYKTYLDDALIIQDTKTFEGVSKTGNIFFACSAKEKIVPKIKSDIESIFSHTEEKRPVFYFCVEDVPVGKRNELIKWCFDNNGVELQIIDGQALSENLSDPDIFWIAEQFLHIPSDIYPKPSNDDERYAEYRESWIENNTQPYNFSDFYEIKYGLRKATFNEKLKPDLQAWISAIQKFLENGGDFLRRKVNYEICVAALRGQNNLTKYKETVVEYFRDFESIEDPAELTDIGVLLMYCSSAKRLGHFDVDASYLHDLSQRYMNRIDHFLEIIVGANTRCTLLENKARAYMLLFYGGEDPKYDLDNSFKYWNELIELVEEAALFPLENFSDTLGVLTGYIGADPRFLELTGKVDKLLAKRVGGFSAAEKCRDRAIAFHESGQILLAIEHLHRAKIDWFSAETLRGTILSLRFVAREYSELGLMYAAKYCLLSASFLAFHSKDQDLGDQVSGSFFELAEAIYKSGEWLTFFSMMELTLLSHHHYDSHPLDMVEHKSLMRTFLYATVIRSLSGRFWPDVKKHIEEKFSKWILDDEMRDELTKLVSEQDGNSYWTKAPLEEIWLQIEKELSGKPFNDVGAMRTINWKALGIEWEVVFENTFELTRVVEEFVAVLQIAQADFALDDIQLLPLKVKINGILSDQEEIEVEEKFDNKTLQWDVKFPKYNDAVPQNIDKRTINTLAYAISVLGYCTTLKKDAFQAKLENAFKNNIFGKAFFARPYPELYKETNSAELFMEVEKFALDIIEAGRVYDFHEHSALTWNNEEGMFYDDKEACLHAQNRYNRMVKLMAVVWPKVLASEKHLEFFLKLKEEGYRDWHISLVACNAVANHIGNKMTWLGVADNRYMAEFKRVVMAVINGEMIEEVKAFDINELNVKELEIAVDTSFVSIMRTWGLDIHTPAPDLPALKEFMKNRYKLFEIDVSHDELF